MVLVPADDAGIVPPPLTALSASAVRAEWVNKK
jgi:hypothetical protein